jgi:hypothetical protein
MAGDSVACKIDTSHERPTATWGAVPDRLARACYSPIRQWWSRFARPGCRLSSESRRPAPLPAGLGLTAYRLVQEGLTNALKPARAQRAEVLVNSATGTSS